MQEFQLKYGTNPNQKPARIYMAEGGELPVTILNGKPGYINFLDAFNSYQLVRDLKKRWRCLPPPASSMFPLPVRPWACRWMSRCAKCTTSPPMWSCLPSPAPTPAPAAPTA